MLKSNPQCDVGGRALVRYLGSEGGAHMNGMSVLIRRSLKASSLPFSTMGGYNKSAVYSPEKGPHQNGPCRHHDLALSASKTVRNKLLLLVSHPVHIIL